MGETTNLKNVLLISVFLVATTCCIAAGRTIYVDDDGPADFNNIQAAIDDSSRGDTIIVNPGTYTGDGNRDIDFEGKSITLQSLDGSHNCVIDCQFDGRAFDLKSTPSFPPSPGQLTIQGFTIKRGHASYGGAVHCEDMRPVFIDCIFEGNNASSFGGALYSEGLMPVLVRCIFKGNSARYGGAIYNSGGNVDFMLISNCVFNGNHTVTKGGAIFAQDGISLTNCTLVGNVTFGDVGGILSNRRIEVRNCILWDNRDSFRNGNTTEQAQITGSPVYTYHCCIEDWSGSFSGYGNIGSDPCLFSDEYHLKPDSFCIGEGRNAFVDIDVDIDGQPRVIDGHVDIGADEFTIQTPSIEISSNSFTFQMDEGGQIPSPQSFDVWNGLLGTLDWSIESDCHWLTVSPLSGRSEAERNEVTLAIDANTLHSGRYDCELTVSDANALNSPQLISVILEVKGPMIGISPETLSFSYYAGLPHPEPKVLSVWNDYIGTLNWSVSEDCNWLNVSPVSGRSDGEINEITVEVDAYGLAAGTYNCVLEVSDSNALNSPVEVPVTLEVRRPVIEVSPEEVSFVHAYGGPNPLPQTISIQNADLGILNWQIIEDCNWISVHPTTGRSQGDANMVNITVDASGLSIGTYSCTLAISDPNAANSPYVVPVSLLIGRQTVHVPEHFSNIQDAIDNVLEGGTVILSQDTYTGPGNRDIDFRSKAITVRSMDPNDPYVVGATIIDCNGTTMERHRGFTFHNYEGPDSIVRGLTIINGFASDGAAILCEDAEPTIANCIFTSNATYIGGGGMIHCDHGRNPTIVDCIITTNDGPGIYCDSSDAVITDCVIEDNRMAGIECIGYSYPVITGCIIRYNSTGIGFRRGGGVVYNCTIIGNSGSGISLYDSGSIIHNCRIISNFGYEGGGIRCSQGSSPTISNCVIAGNSATKNGGGIYCYGYDESRPKIINCVIINNEALGYGGGIYSFDETEPIITNSILWGNSAKAGAEIALYSNSGHGRPGNMTISYSDVQGGQEGVFVDIDCMLDWGMGMVDATPGFAFEGDYHLVSYSPCIDTGTNNPYGGLPGWDFDGNLRPMDGDENGLPIADIGVYEFNPQQPSIALSADSLEFFTQEDGPDPNGQILSVRNAGGNTLVWEIVEDCDWLEAIPATGTSDGEINDVMLNVSSTGLTHGIYNCELRIKNEQAVNNPREVMIILYVNKTLYVPSEYGTIQGAIDDSIDADVVLVADNTYVGEGNKDLDFKGKNIIVRSENGPDNCIIDCQGQGRGFFLHSRETYPAAIEGFTIINGCPDTTIGGGILCTGYSSPTIKNCVIKNCTSTDPYGTGYGIYCGYGTKIESCTVQGNKGGIVAVYGAAIRNCVINENYDASGIFCQGGMPTIKFCTITNNQGGGISLARNDAIVKNCIITGNVVKEEHSYFAVGGGISCFMGSNPAISNTIISGNFTEFGGGGIFCNMESNANIINCTITGNRANLCGGGIWILDDCYPLVTNCILWENAADLGSQIAMGFPDYPEDGYGGISVNYSDVEGGTAQVFAGSNYVLDWGLGNIDTDSCFVEPGYWDVNSLWLDGDYHLLPGSPCIDAGDPNYIAEPNETDLDGKPRVIGGRIDMGAYEFNNIPVADAGPDQTVEAQAPWGATVTLDGSGSSDADSTPGTNDDIVYFDWYKVDPCDPNADVFLGSGQIIDCNLPIGEHIILLEVIDKAGAYDTNEVTIIVQDTTPPQFQLSVAPTMLWPPDHKMVQITPSWTVSDECDATPDVSLVGIAANE
ncbi:MAG: right-handed parallel beta-helix repeat-containing protein, partial [Planctomycetota bacterium]